ncbi:MAG TPA: hypothetical protein VGE02_03190 [Gemmatimonadales bacterium]
MSEREGGDRGEGRISRWEWLTAAVGLVLVLAAIGYLTYEAVIEDDLPPVMSVVADSVTTAGGVHQVHFTVSNLGGKAGAAVVVEGRLSGGPDGDEETSETTLDYVPARSERMGGLFFSRDPRAGRVELRALGYSVP